MMLEKAREFAQDSAGQAINEAVISIPGYFGQAERSAILNAAEIAGIKVLQLINSYTAGKKIYTQYLFAQNQLKHELLKSQVL